MIYIINNNTTHNYSRYSTRPSHIYNALLKVKCPTQNMVKPDMLENNQPYLFQTKQLLCWGPDLAFLNLRNTFSNIFKALQICWSAARNNKKIVFINGNDSIEADSILVNSWLIQQCKRHCMPRKLNNISNIAAKYMNHLTVPSKDLAIAILPNKALFNHFNTFLNSLKIKTTYVQNRKAQRFIKNSNVVQRSFNCTLTKPKEVHFPAYNHTENLMRTQQEKEANNRFKKKNLSITTGKIVYNNTQCGKARAIIEDHNQLQIKMKNAIQLQVKEAETLTQQIAGEVTAPLVGFLTNTKTGFNALQNKLNEEFYNHCKSVYFNNISKSSSKANAKKRVVFVFLGKQKQKDFCLKSKGTPWGLKLKTSRPPLDAKLQLAPIRQDINYNNYTSFYGARKLSFKEGAYSENYLPFSFYIRPVTQFVYFDNLLKTREQCKAEQSIVRQNLFGKIFAWRLKGQHLSSIFYSQFKIFDQRDKYKPLTKQITIPNQNNVEAFKVAGQLFRKLESSKSQVLFKNTKNFISFSSALTLKRVFFNNNKVSFNFYSDSLKKSYRINSKDSRLVPLSIGDVKPLKLRKNKYNSNTFVVKKKANRNSINNFYISQFYQSVKDTRADSKQNKPNIIKSNRSSVTSLFRNYYTFKAYQKKVSKQVIPKLFRYHERKKNYYDKLVNSNQLNQYQMFAKSPFINNKLADIIFFINPEKNQNLVNQANCLKIPTIGVISGITSFELGRQSCNHYSLNNLVNYPILGNPSSSFFIYILIGMFIKILRSS